MDASPFQRLSAELRNAIWELALTQPEAVVCEGTVDTVSFMLTDTLALTRTCKQVHNECGRLYFIHNKFEIRTHDFSIRCRGPYWRTTYDSLHLFNGMLGRDNAEAVQDMTIHLGTIPYGSSIGNVSRHLTRYLCTMRLFAATVPQWRLKVAFGVRVFQKHTTHLHETYTCTICLDDAERSMEELIAETGRETARRCDWLGSEMDHARWQELGEVLQQITTAMPDVIIECARAVRFQEGFKVVFLPGTYC